MVMNVFSAFRGGKSGEQLSRSNEAGERRVATEIRDDLLVSELVRSELRFVFEKAPGG